MRIIMSVALIISLSSSGICAEKPSLTKTLVGSAIMSGVASYMFSIKASELNEKASDIRMSSNWLRSDAAFMSAQRNAWGLDKQATNKKHIAEYLMGISAALVIGSVVSYTTSLRIEHDKEQMQLLLDLKFGGQNESK